MTHDHQKENQVLIRVYEKMGVLSTYLYAPKELRVLYLLLNNPRIHNTAFQLNMEHINPTHQITQVNC